MNIGHIENFLRRLEKSFGGFWVYSDVFCVGSRPGDREEWKKHVFLNLFYLVVYMKKYGANDPNFFTSPLFGGEIYTGNLLWTKYRLTFQDLGCLKKGISFRLDWKFLPSSNSDMWIFIRKLENRFLEYSISIFCHEIAHALGLSTWLS